MKGLIKIYISLEKNFKKINLSEYSHPDDYSNDLEKALWVLWVAQEKFNFSGYVDAKTISTILEQKGVAVDSIEVKRAMARAGKRARVGQPGFYKIMKKGIDHLRSIEGKDKISIFYIEGAKPRHDRKLFEQIINSTRGEICIVDKFCARSSLDILEKINSNRKVKFLIGEIKDDESKFKRELSTFKRTFRNFDIKRYARAFELHDRYVITDDSLFFLGHGLKDLGDKESFIIVFRDEHGKEIRNLLKKKFEERWPISQGI